MISIVIPCFNEEEALPVYYREMKKVMEEMKEQSFELLFVDDGSADGTLEWMRRMHQEDERCRYLSFSRNFGKEAAIYAGLSKAKGEYVAVMDADLQDPPSLLPEMYRILQEEPYDSVATRRSTRAGEPWLRSKLSGCFYGFVNRISKTQIVSGARDYRLMKRSMVDAILELQEYSRFTKGMFGWVGFRTRWLEFENVERCAGETKWKLGKLFLYALEGIGGFSTAPLFLAPFLGCLLCLAAVATGTVSLIAALAGGGHVQGIVLLAALVLLVGGIQLVCSGISAWYLSRTYLEAKHRPIYILQESSEDKQTRVMLVPVKKESRYETA
ncbi:MAG: glycosyltransferase family 2 protein [Lachnospiraceae bacterium]|uniref:glycosyltransferase family 2 protein n=1 Tax=Parablautia sp. Marseille-Q6255 TaxID=3039593 RepID=UPI0024BC7E2C|nr:glycosyltransferase family 2 protein [Parablautia sp. Marseille-Q6255]